LQAQGRREEALACYEASLRLNPQQPMAYLNLGAVLQQQKRFKDAEDAYRGALRIKPDFALAAVQLGNALRAQGKTADAIASFRKAIEINPDNADIHYNFGLALQDCGRFEEAIASYRNALRLKPDRADIYVWLASAHQAKSDYPEAIANCQEALRLKPDYAEAHHGLAVSLIAMGRQDEAVLSYQQAVRFKPDYADAYLGLAVTSMTLNNPEAASSYCDKALQLEPTNANAVALAANIAKHRGDTERAFQLLSPLLDARVEQVNVSLAFAIISKDLGRQEQAIAMMEKHLAAGNILGVSSRSNLHFALGKLYDGIKQYDKAFSHYQQGNALKTLTFDQTEYAHHIERHIAIHSHDFMAHMPRASVISDRPVFIVGMVRSGTSLVEQILSSHPDVHGAGELPDIIQITNGLQDFLGAGAPYPECLPLLKQEHLDALSQHYLEHLKQISPDARRVVDKMPGNFMHLGLIEMLFPEARVIHCMRDPVDTCLSAYFQDFSRSHPYAYDLSNLGAFYRAYLKVMAHWRKILRLPLFELQYEDLIANQEQVSRALIEFCGLEWDDRCLQFHETQRFVGTASYDQVNRPLYKQSVARWKRYERHLGPLLAALKE
jgi:tetratricopeptide (TPR) repeat protein